MDASTDLIPEVPIARACELLDLNRGTFYRARSGFVEPMTPPVPNPLEPGPSLRHDAANPANASQVDDPDPRACDAVGTRVTRANASVRELPRTPRAPADAELVRAIEHVIETSPCYGYRRVTAQLQREGWLVNHKRVHRLMAQEGLLRRRKRRFIRTTDSSHDLPIFRNLLPDNGWRRLTAPDQAWVADLTYIRLGEGFCYLALIMDAFSRKILGWNLGIGLDTSLALRALEQALACRQPPEGFIHHSDRGSQYASHAYVQRLRAAGARISMTNVGAPRENAQAERLMRTIKEEEVDLQDYANIDAARSSISAFVNDVYNRKRVHSALGYLPPVEFEERFLTP